MESWVQAIIKMEEKSKENWSRNRANTLYYIGGDVRQRCLAAVFILNERRKRSLKGWLKLRTLVPLSLFPLNIKEKKRRLASTRNTDPPMPQRLGFLVHLALGFLAG